MGDKPVQIEIRGLKELKKAFGQIDAGLKKELKEGFKAVAEMVASAARSKVPHDTGRAAGSIKPRGSLKGGAIAFGGSAAPYYPWLDFGGSTGRGHTPGQAGSGAIKRDFKPEGRYVYPTIREKRDDIMDQTDDILEGLIKKAGFETHG